MIADRAAQDGVLLLERIQYLPGVTSASLINSMPFGRMFIQDNFEIEGQPKPACVAEIVFRYYE